MRAWGERRRARRGSALLPADPRHSGRGSAAYADRGLSARAGRGDSRTGIARASAASLGAASRQTGGVGMAASPLRFEKSPVRGFDPRALRREFPIFTKHPDLVFLDSGASAQKPRSVIAGIAEFYGTDYAHVHRGVYHRRARSTHPSARARSK